MITESAYLRKTTSYYRSVSRITLHLISLLQEYTMRGFLLIACLLLAGPVFSSASESTETQRVSDWQNPMWCIGNCPSRDPMDRTILLSHWDCDKYCACGNGRAIVMICPAGLFFSLKLQACVSSNQADCHTTEFFNLSNFEEENASVERALENPDTCIGKCPPIDDPEKVTLLANKDKHKFCMCQYGTPYVRDCPANLIFSVKCQACVWSYNKECFY